MKTAILVDGGFYRKRSQIVLGDISAQKRASELSNYCKRHLKFNTGQIHNSAPHHNSLFIYFTIKALHHQIPRNVKLNSTF